MTTRSETDVHWNDRAVKEREVVHVNIADINQRELEFEAIRPFLNPEMEVLEVGCGNGYSTDRFRAQVRHVDAFDYAENMIAAALERYGESNNRFFKDDVLNPVHWRDRYDTVICIRVLINLRNLDEQKQAITNMLEVLRPGGRFILVEGYREGFEALTEVRVQCGLAPVQPARINFYSSQADLLPTIETQCTLEEKFHLGAYDYLTRIVYPLITPPEEVTHNTSFSEKAAVLARAFNDDCFSRFSRLHGLIFTKM